MGIDSFLGHSHTWPRLGAVGSRFLAKHYSALGSLRGLRKPKRVRRKVHAMFFYIRLHPIAQRGCAAREAISGDFLSSSFSLPTALTTMWCLDVDNTPHPHLTLESSDDVQSSHTNIRSPTINLRASAIAESDDLCQRHQKYFFANDNIIFQVCLLPRVLRYNRDRTFAWVGRRDQVQDPPILLSARFRDFLHNIRSSRWTRARFVGLQSNSLSRHQSS